jgi:hypothetical protein
VNVAPVAIMAQDSYSINKEVKNTLPGFAFIYQKGGGVEVQMFSLVTQPTYLKKITALLNTTEITKFNNYWIQKCNKYKHVENLKFKKVACIVYRFPRDGLRCV